MLLLGGFVHYGQWPAVSCSISVLILFHIIQLPQSPKLKYKTIDEQILNPPQ